MSATHIVPEDLCILLENLKATIDVAEDWNGAIRDALETLPLLELMTKYTLKKHDLRCYLAGRYGFKSPSSIEPSQATRRASHHPDELVHPAF